MTEKRNISDGGSQGVAPGTSPVAGSGDAFFSVTNTSLGTVVCDSAAAVHGPYGLTFTRTAAGSTPAMVSLDLGASSPSTGVVLGSAHFKGGVTRPTVTTSIIQLRNATPAAMLTVQVTSAGKIVLLHAASSAISGVSTTYVLPQPGDGHDVRIVALAVPNASTTAGTATVNVYLDESTTADYSFTTSTTNTGTVAGRYCRYGIIGDPGGAYSIKADDLYINDTGIDPGPLSTDTVTAGSDQTVEPWSTVTLTATADSGAATWTQQSGTAVTLNGAGALVRTFTAPADFAGAALVFRATNGTATDDVSVTVLPATDGLVVSTGPVVVIPIRLTVVT